MSCEPLGVNTGYKSFFRCEALLEKEFLFDRWLFEPLDDRSKSLFSSKSIWSLDKIESRRSCAWFWSFLSSSYDFSSARLILLWSFGEPASERGDSSNCSKSFNDCKTDSAAIELFIPLYTCSFIDYPRIFSAAIFSDECCSCMSISYVRLSILILFLLASAMLRRTSSLAGWMSSSALFVPEKYL